MANYNGKKESMCRRYDSLRHFVGQNRVFPCGDVLCVSTRNNDDYNVFIMADGRSNFVTLYKKYLIGGGIISDVPEGSVGTAQLVPGAVTPDKLSPEVLAGLDELNNIKITDEDIENWFDDDPNNDDPEE